MEKLIFPDRHKEGACGIGVPVPRGTSLQAHWCPVHQYDYWRRDDPFELAKAAVILEALKKRDYAGMDAEPSKELIAQARQLILAHEPIPKFRSQLQT